ncbi:MAG: YitT family protein [Kiritimatiellia bacterium]
MKPLLSFREVAWNMLLITAGSLLSAVAINGLLVPHKFVSGGMMGFALLVQYAVPAIPAGIWYILMNIPIFILAWICVGRRFFFYSLAGLAIFSAAVLFINVGVKLEDKLLAAIMAGILSGVGVGMILRSQGSSGGADILSVIFLKRFSLRVGHTVFYLNCIVVLLALLMQSLESVLYTIIYLYVNSGVLNLVLNGLSQRKALFIVSEKWEEIAAEIQTELDRTMTLLHASRGITRTDTRALYTVVTFRDVAPMKRIISGIDPGAFVVVQDTVEVMNARIGNQPHW